MIEGEKELLACLEVYMIQTAMLLLLTLILWAKKIIWHVMAITSKNKESRCKQVPIVSHSPSP